MRTESMKFVLPAVRRRRIRSVMDTENFCWLIITTQYSETVSSLEECRRLGRGADVSDSTRSTRPHFPEDGIHHSHRRENLKSYAVSVLFVAQRKWRTASKEM
jgi:hypothetical protein